MSNSVKHLIVRVALTLLRAAMKLKLDWVARPFKTVGAFLFRVAFVPTYRVLLQARRQIGRLYLPAKNRLLFLFSNRLAIHAAIVLVAAWSALLNTNTRGAHAEGLGDDSVLLVLLGGESAGITEEAAGDAPFVAESRTYESSVVALATPLAREVDYGVIATTSPQSIAGIVAPMTGLAERLTQTTTAAKRVGSEIYTVQEGDTISSIADQFDLSITTILWANDLSVRSIIRPGDTLTILPVDGVVHKVKSGDTMSRIAALYDVPASEIAVYNAKEDPNDLSIGEALVIPGGEKSAPAPARSVASVASIFAPSQSVSSTAAAAAGGMIWPSDLRKVNLYYGVLYFLGRHTGVDIDCNYNNNNYAAADGIVTYSGWRRGYGYAVEIDHGNGIATRYGHNAKIYVTSGQSVAQGDPIALCGSTGNSTGTHLHFEVIVNGRFVNPLGYIQ